jgi:hypothetical protein
MPFTHAGTYLRTGDNWTQNGNAVIPGVATSPIFVYSIVPPTLDAAAIGAAAAVSAAAWTLAAATGTTTVTINGTSYIDLGVQRSVTLSGAQTSAVAVNATITGLDNYLVPLTQTISSPVSTAIVATTKTFRYIPVVGGVTAAGNTVGTVSVGTGDVFGLPYVVNNWGDVDVTWNSVKATASTGFVAAVTTSPATAYTGDVRGTYAVQTTASDSTRRLVAWVYISNPNTRAGAYGVVQA